MSAKESSICINVIFLSVFLLFLQVASAQEGWKKDIEQEIQTKQKILGNNFVMMVWKNDTIAYKKEVGGFNSKTQAPVASSSKWLTAALVMIFVDEGKISLDDKVSKWLPEFERYGKNYITLRLCMSHMTGIDDDSRFMKKLLQRTKFASLEEEVNAFAARKIRSNPGEDFWYGNIGLNIAGRVLEVVSKKRFDVLIKQKLFNPLAMRRTSFTTPDASAVNPSGGAVSTADDYMQFLVMLLNKGKYKGKQVLSEESVNELMKVQTKPGLIKYAPPAGLGFNYALGAWALEEKDGKAIAVACPGLFGTWPMIDYCRGYACLFFTKSLLSEQKADTYMTFKEMIGGQPCQ